MNQLDPIHPLYRIQSSYIVEPHYTTPQLRIWTTPCLLLIPHALVPKWRLGNDETILLSALNRSMSLLRSSFYLLLGRFAVLTRKIQQGRVISSIFSPKSIGHFQEKYNSLSFIG